MFRVEVLDASVDDGRMTAAVSVKNNDSRRQNVDVSLTLGAFGSTEAWSRRVAEASSKAVGIRSDEEVLVVWDELVAVPTGSYELTVWIRTERADGLVTQETAEFAIEAESSSPSRVAPPGPGPSLDEPNLTVRGGGLLTIGGSVAAEGAETGSVLKLDLLDASDSQPWWARPAIDSYIFDDRVESEPQRFSVDSMSAVPSGTYAVRIELLNEDVVEDSILLAGTVVITPPDDAIRRVELPSGPLAITGVTVEQRVEANDLIVSLEVQNMSTDPVDGLFWWLLSSPGEPEPWRFVDARSFEVGRRLEPRERRTIRLALDGVMNTGTGFELSLWAHTTVPGADSTHSDGVRLKELMDTYSTESEA